MVPTKQKKAEKTVYYIHMKSMCWLRFDIEILVSALAVYEPLRGAIQVAVHVIG